MTTCRLTMAQALIRYLQAQYVERDGEEQPFFAGCFGIFGHGNVAGVGQALQQTPEFPYFLFRNEQAMVHAAVGYSRMKNRLGCYACTTSIGPGATNMVTGAALATINRIPVLLLPGDIFARRNVAPVLQQLESESSQDISVNDCFKPVSRYWDRINRADQLIHTLPEVMRVLTSPSNTGAVTLSLPQDVQTEAYDYPVGLFEKKVWTIGRARADEGMLERAVSWIRESKAPMIVAGGGTIYSGATEALDSFVKATGIPVGETQAGKGSLLYDHPSCLGGMGVTGTKGANITARDADLIIGIGTRYSDFTTASKTAFANPSVRFININVAEFDAHKHNALSLVADARVTLTELGEKLSGWSVDDGYRNNAAGLVKEWDAEVERIYSHDPQPLPAQGAVFGAINSFSDPHDVVVNAAGSGPGDLHKLWRTRDPKGYHIEYGYSCMGYEIPGGLGIKLAAPEREVYVVVGDGSYLMMPQDIVTAVQEGIKLTIVLVDNHGFASIGGLSEALGSAGFGTEYRFRSDDGQLKGTPIPVDYAANARSLGAHTIVAKSIGEFKEALVEAKAQSQTTVIVIETEREERVGGYESWWDVPIAEVSEVDEVNAARADYEKALLGERSYHAEGKQ